MSFQFCEKLPKVELHAHLNGSLSNKTLKELKCLDRSIEEYQKLNKIIDKNDRTLEECFKLFSVAHEATKNKDAVYFATRSVIREFAEDNVIYLELRTTPRKEEGMSKVEYIQSIITAIKDEKSDIMVKLLLSLDRKCAVEDLTDTLDVILDQKRKYPDIIKGIDLSGNPNLGTFSEELFQKARMNGLFTAVHCAEVINNIEVENILNFCPDRIGHATFLHPHYGGSQGNWDLYCKRRIPLECCLTSNVVCGTSHSYEKHHVQEWIKHSLPFSICTDDKGVFCTSLSQEFEHLAKTFHLVPKDLWNISYNSIEQSFASPEEKIYLQRKLLRWKEENVSLFS